jgi:hypothetical protein
MSVIQEHDILCDIYGDTHSDVSDKNDNEILDSDSDVLTTSSHKQLRPSDINFTSGSETSAAEEESSGSETSAAEEESSELERYNNNNKTSDT